MLDSNLSWKFHFAELSKKLARTARLFCKIRHNAPADTSTLLYHGIFAPFLSYCLSVWGLTYPSLLEPITVLQKKILRMSFSKTNAPSGPLFDRPQILKLNDMFRLQVASFVYECTNNIASVYFTNYFTRINIIHRISTHRSMENDLYAVSCNTTQYGLISIHYSGVRLWKSLPLEIKDSNTLSNFKRKLKHYCLGCYKL